MVQQNNMRPQIPAGVAQSPQQNNMRPQIPAGVAQSPQFAAARSITQEGLPAAFKQLLEDEITFKAMELLDGSANEQAMGELPSPDSVRTQTREGLMSMLGSIGPGIQQQGQRSMQRPQTAGQFASGGIVGFAKGGMKKDRVKTKAYRPQSAIPVGNPNQPIPMLMQKYGGEKVLGYLAEKKALDAKARALAEAGPAAGSMQIEDHKLMKEIFSEKYRDILNESMGMAGGGIVGFQDGGRIKRFQGLEGSEVEGSGGRIKRFEERAVIADEQVRAYLSSLGRDIADFTAQQIAAVKEIMGNTNLGASSEARAARAAQIANVANMPLDMLNSPVARSQNDIMSQVGRGAMGAIADAETSMSQGQIGAREAQLESGRGGIGAVLSRDNSGPSVTDQLLAAEQRRTEANLTDEERAQRDKYNPVAHQQLLREQDMGRPDPNYFPQEAPVPPKEGGGIMNALRNTYGSLGRDMNPPAVPAVSKFQQELIDAGNANVNDQLLAADQRGGGIASNLSPSMFERVLPGLSGLYTDEMRAADEAAENMTLAEGMGQFGEDVGGVMRRIGSAIPTDADIMGGIDNFAEGLGVDLDELGRAMYPRSTRYGEVAAETGVQAPFLKRFGASIRDVSGIPKRAAQGLYGLAEEPITQFGTGLLEEVDDIGQEVAQTDAAVVADIVNNAPAVEASATYDPTKDVEQIANPNLRRAIEGPQAAPVSETVEEVVVEGVNSGSIGSGGFQARLDAVIARQDDPLEAISTFLRAMGEGDTIGEGLQIAGKALDARRRSNDAEQVALLKLLEAGSINERDYKLKQEQLKLERQNVENQRERYEAQAANETERTRITGVYYTALSGNNKQAADQALGELRASYLEGTAIENDMMGALGFSLKQLDRLRENNYPAFETARTEALNKYMRAVTGAAPAATSGLDPATQAVFNRYQ